MGAEQKQFFGARIAVLFDGMEEESVVYGDWPSEKIAVDFGEETEEEE